MFLRSWGDVFEFEYQDPTAKANMKMKFLLWRDRASGLTLIDHLQTFEAKDCWEPTTDHVIRSLMKWQMHYPSPRAGFHRCGASWRNCLRRSPCRSSLVDGE